MIDSKTKLIGLIGHPVEHSLSPQMHNTMLKKLALNYRYLAFHINEDQLEKSLIGMRSLNITGYNVTIPYKVRVIPFLDELSEEARTIGAVNTIVNNNGCLIGYNTDGTGYVKSLLEETGISLKNKRVIVLGAGGASKAICYALAKHNLETITIVNRDYDKVRDIMKMLENRLPVVQEEYTNIQNIIPHSDIIINTTSVGMAPDINKTLIEQKWLNSNHIVSDIVYHPLETKLIKDAREKGAITHTGLGMFVNQGMLSFEKFTGVLPNPIEMRKIVLNLLNKEK